MGLISILELPNQGGSKWLDNDDVRPVPRDRRTWGFLFFNLFWIAACTNISNMMSGSSFLTFGLTYWEGVGAATAGFFLVSIFMALNGRPGAFWHIPFPVAARASWGVVGFSFACLNRAFMACFWNAINTASGAQCLYVMIYAVFPSIGSAKNTMPSGSALNSAEYGLMYIFVFLTGLMSFIDIRRWNLLVYAKIVVFSLSAAGMIAMGVKSAGGVGPVVSEPSKLQSSEKGWLIVQLILVSAASCSTFASNASDWQRNARKPSDPILGQLIGFPLANFFIQSIGMLIASTSAGVYGEVIWNPVVYLQRLLEDDFTAGRRAGCFFIAGGFVFSLLYSCVIENCYPASCDLASLCPRFISIKRGYIVCLIVTIVLQPEFLIGKASIFISVLASYQIFLWSIMAIMMTHYFIIAKGGLDIEALYTADNKGTYYYTYGVNLRAVAAYLVGVAVNFAGFLQNLNVIEPDNTPLRRSYFFAIFTTSAAAGGTYYLLCKVYPQVDHQKRWMEPKGGYEPDVSNVTSSSGGADEEEKVSIDDIEKDSSVVTTRTTEVPELRA